MYTCNQIGDIEMTKTSTYRKTLEIKDTYNPIQIMDIESWNSKVIEMNNLCEELENVSYTDPSTYREHCNKQVDLHKKHMKNTKPNWLK